MNVNNQCYKMFNLMMHGYETGNPDEIEQGARCWIDLAPQNPFEYESDEMEAFFHMQMCYKKWRSGGIDHKINRRRMIMWTEKLCALNPQNPYKFDKKAEEEELRAEKEKYEQSLVKNEPKKVILEEPVKVMNVVPKKKNRLLNMFARNKEGEQNDGAGIN